jgi:hypothetical protein
MPRLAHSLSLLASAAALSGCLQRTLTITSTPPGALVWVNDVEVGTTPLDIDFTYYGGYDVRVRRDGYEPILEKRKIKAPLREAPVVDLAAEAIPVDFHNRVRWHFDLTPIAESVDPAAAERDLIARASDLRTQIPISSTPPESPAPEGQGDAPAAAEPTGTSGAPAQPSE